MLPAPTPSAMLTAWTVQPVAIAVAVLLVGWYVAAGRGRVRPGQAAVFAVGVALLLWSTCGFAGVYLGHPFWVWTAQQLALLLVVPYVVLAGGPLDLAGRPVRWFIGTPFVRTLANPLIGPALVPLLSVVLFFGPVPRWAVAVPVFGWVEQLLVVVIGALIMLPLVGAGGVPRSSLAVGVSLAIGSLELVVDALPGIALRLHRTLLTSYFDIRPNHPWSPAPLHDQQIAGAVLWAVAELLDLPFLILVFRQWIRADARDAADIDAVLEAERAARGDESDELGRDAPWWLSDPAMRDRMGRG